MAEDPHIISSELVLASSSPRRAQLLSEAGIAIRVIPSVVDEESIDVDDHGEFARMAAVLKAGDVASRSMEGAFVLAADTIVCVGEERLGKPIDEDDAQRMMRLLEDRRHEVITGVALCRVGLASCMSDSVTTSVWFGKIPGNELEAYLKTPEPYDKAGAYGIQGWAGQYITKVEGDYNNVVGLPLERVLGMLKEAGFRSSRL